MFPGLASLASRVTSILPCCVRSQEGVGNLPRALGHLPEGNSQLLEAELVGVGRQCWDGLWSHG